MSAWMPRDAQIEKDIGAVFDQLDPVLTSLEAAMRAAVEAGADGHAEFYEVVYGDLLDAKAALTSASVAILKGNEDLGVLPLREVTS